MTLHKWGVVKPMPQAERQGPILSHFNLPVTGHVNLYCSKRQIFVGRIDVLILGVIVLLHLLHVWNVWTTSCRATIVVSASCLNLSLLVRLRGLDVRNSRVGIHDILQLLGPINLVLRLHCLTSSSDSDANGWRLLICSSRRKTQSKRNANKL